MFIHHPHLREAVRHEIEEGWTEGWPAAALSVEESDNWTERRAQCLFLYEVSDIEYKGARPWDARQPAHLSPESDLYWAMRVGYCDAHLSDSSAGEGITLAGVSEQVSDVKEMVTASSLRALRSQEQIKGGIKSLTTAIPTPATARDRIMEALGSAMFGELPAKTIEHLIDAWMASQQWHADEARLSVTKAIESVFTRLIKSKLATTESNFLKIRITVARQNGTEWYCSVSNMRKIQLGEWAGVLPGLEIVDGSNSEFAAAIRQAFPDADINALGKCSAELTEVPEARGQAGHDGDREDFDHAFAQAEKLWSIALGSLETPGLIAKLCLALGIVGKVPGDSA